MVQRITADLGLHGHNKNVVAAGSFPRREPGGGRNAPHKLDVGCRRSRRYSAGGDRGRGPSPREVVRGGGGVPIALGPLLPAATPGISRGRRAGYARGRTPVAEARARLRARGGGVLRGGGGTDHALRVVARDPRRPRRRPAPLQRGAGQPFLSGQRHAEPLVELPLPRGDGHRPLALLRRLRPDSRGRVGRPVARRGTPARPAADAGQRALPRVRRLLFSGGAWAGLGGPTALPAPGTSREVRQIRRPRPAHRPGPELRLRGVYRSSPTSRSPRLSWTVTRSTSRAPWGYLSRTRSLSCALDPWSYWWGSS